MYCDPLKVVCMVIPTGRVSAALSLMAVTVILPVCASAVAVTPDGVCSSILSKARGVVPYQALTVVDTGSPSTTCRFWSQATDAISLSMSAMMGFRPLRITVTLYTLSNTALPSQFIFIAT